MYLIRHYNYTTVSYYVSRINLKYLRLNPDFLSMRTQRAKEKSTAKQSTLFRIRSTETFHTPLDFSKFVV